MAHHFTCLAHVERALAPHVRDGGLGHGEGLGVAVAVPPVAHLLAIGLLLRWRDKRVSVSGGWEKEGRGESKGGWSMVVSSSLVVGHGQQALQGKKGERGGCRPTRLLDLDIEVVGGAALPKLVPQVRADQLHDPVVFGVVLYGCNQ